MAYEIKRGDLEPPLNATLKQADGTAINLSTAVSVRALLRHVDTGAVTLNRTATIVSAAAGTVRITWAGSETALAGRYELEFEITWPGPRLQTVPSLGYFTFTISEDLG